MSLESIPLPSVGRKQALVKVSHVAQNPTDGRSICTILKRERGLICGLDQSNLSTQMLSAKVPCLVCIHDTPCLRERRLTLLLLLLPGCDFAGTVVSVGEDSTKLKPGDHIVGLIWGGNET